MARKITAIAPHKSFEFQRKKVAAYARVSSGKDAMLHSLSAQVSYYSKMIQSRPKWQYVGRIWISKLLPGESVYSK